MKSEQFADFIDLTDENLEEVNIQGGQFGFGGCGGFGGFGGCGGFGGFGGCGCGGFGCFSIQIDFEFGSCFSCFGGFGGCGGFGGFGGCGGF